jgi:CRP-like cAMP-binding protein
LRQSSILSEIILEAISHDLAVLTNRIHAFAQRGIRERLALFLLILNETYRKPEQEQDASNIQMNRNDLASFTGTSVENLVRTLKVFREQGLVKGEGKSIYIENFEALHDLCKN